MINGVMLGAIAGARVLPIPAEAFEGAIRADGKAVETNLRGFRAGYEAAAAGSGLPGEAPKRPHPPSLSVADLEREIESVPAAAQAVMIKGVRRLAAYQLLSMRGSTSTGLNRSAPPMPRPAPAGNCSPWLRASLRCVCPMRT